MRQQHDQLAEEYAQQEQAGGLSLLGLREGVDDEAIAIHKAFMEQTKAAADELATKGFIDGGRRKNLYSLKQKYNNEVVPLQNQLKIRQERAEELRRMQLQDPTFRATMNPNDISLTAGLKNPDAFNYSGVSGNQLYKTAAEKISQLSKVIDQEIPELKRMPKLSFQYFTMIQSGATPEQAANAMKREGFDPTTVDKMTVMIHNTINTTMDEFGVYDKFANSPETIDELWNSTAQAAYHALGQKQFGNVTDSWGMTMRQRAMDAPQAPTPPKILREFNPDFNKEGIEALDNILAEANATKIKVSDKSSTGGVIYDREGNVMPQLSYNESASSEARAAAQNKINKIANDLSRRGLFQMPRGGKVASKDLANWNRSVIEAAKQEYQSLNMTSYSENTNDVVENALSKLSSYDEDIRTVDGKKISEFTIEPNTKSSISWNAKTGDVHLRFTPKGKTKRTSVQVPVDIFGDTKAMELKGIVDYFNKLALERQLTNEEFHAYEHYSREFDNAMNQITNTQQSVYNYQPAR